MPEPTPVRRGMAEDETPMEKVARIITNMKSSKTKSSH